MISLVIVDDDADIIENMKKYLPLNDLGIDLVATATNANDGIDSILQTKPDIILCDIVMPDMSGFDMIRSIKKLSLSPIIIMLTGCVDFDNAKHAIDENIFAYIVKPATPIEIADVLKNAVQEYQKRRSQSISNILMNNDVFKAEQQSTENYFVYNYSFFVSVRFLGSNKNRNINEIIQKLQTIVSSKFRIFFTNKKDDIFFLLATSDSKDITSVICSSLSGLCNEYNFFACIGLAYDSMKDISKSYEQSLKMQEYAFCYDYTPKCIEYISTNMKLSASKQNLPEFNYANLIHAVNNNNYAMNREILYSAKKYFDKYEIYEPDVLKFFVYNYCMAIINKECYQPKVHPSYSDLWNEINSLPSKSKIFDYCNSIVIDYELFTNNQAKNRKIIEEINLYVENNYMHSITLKSMSEHFLYSMNYIRIIFERFFGMSFKEYLQKYRMKKAAELILLNKYNIEVIAKKVGYSDIKTFRNVFKKIYGVLPSEFAKS